MQEGARRTAARPSAVGDVVVGVDAGNTKTVALVAGRDGAIRGIGRGGCGDIYGAGTAEGALSAVEHAVHAALAMAGARPPEVTTAVFNMAGADWPEDFVFLRDAMARRGFGRAIHVVNDAMGALRAGSPDNTGVVVVCGTGAAIGARAPDGRLWHSSFWQEPQGAHQLGEKALRAVYRAALGIDLPTTLTERVLAYFQLPTVEDVLHAMTARLHPQGSPARMAELCRVLLDEAERGDPAARALVEGHGSLLGDYALVAARQVGLAGSAFPLVLMGGVLRHPSRLLVDAIITRVRATAPGAVPVRGRIEPAAGALLLALEAAGMVVDPSLQRALEATLPPPEFFAT